LAREGISPAANNAKAAKVLKEALRIDNALFRKEPTDYRCVLNQAATYASLGKVLEAQGHPGPGRAAQKKALQILLDYFQDRAAEEPRNLTWLEHIAAEHQALGYWYNRPGEYGRKLVQHRAALRSYERLLKLEPNNNRRLYPLAMAHKWVSQALSLKAKAAVNGGNPGKLGTRAFAQLWKSAEYAESLEVLRRGVRLLEQLTRREPKNARWQLALAEGYYDLAGAHHSRNNYLEQETAFAGYLKAREKALALDPEAARQNPLENEKPLSTAGMAIRQLYSSPLDPRDHVLLSEHSLYYLETLDKDQNLIESYMGLIRSLDLSREKGARERRWALRRGLGFLRRRLAQKRLLRVQQRLIPFFEAALKKLPGPAPEGTFPGPFQQAREELDYRRLAELLLREGRPRELVRLLAREAREAAQDPWALEMVRIVAARALLLKPDLLGPVLETARRMVREEPKPFSTQGRALLAFLARYGGQPETAVLLDPGEARAPVDQPLSSFLSRRQRLAGLPDDLRTPWEIAEYYSLVRKFPQGADQWRKLLHNGRLTAAYFRNWARLNLAIGYWEQGEWKKAESELKTILANYPGYSWAQHYLAQVYGEQNKKLKQAEALTRTALRAQPKSAPFRAGLGWLLVLQNRGLEGLKMMEEVAGSPELAQDLIFFDRLGDGYHRQGQPDKARRAWRKALSFFPNSTPLNDRRQAAIRRKLASLAPKTGSGTDRKPKKR
jgi:tetratricopeptide (TPR) repeat protein